METHDKLVVGKRVVCVWKKHAVSDSTLISNIIGSVLLQMKEIIFIVLSCNSSRWLVCIWNKRVVSAAGKA